MDLAAKCDIKGTVDIVVIRKGQEVDHMSTGNSFFGNAAAKAISGTTTNIPTKVVMTAGAQDFIVPVGYSPSATGAVVQYIFSATNVSTGGVTNWTFYLRDGSTSSSAGNTWASATVNPITRVYTGDTLQITWEHTVSGLTTPGNNAIATFLATGSGSGVSSIGVCNSVSTNGTINYGTAATFETKSNNGDIGTATGSYPNSGGDAFPDGSVNTQSNQKGYVGVGSTAWGEFDISTTQRNAAAGRRANVTFNVDF